MTSLRYITYYIILLREPFFPYQEHKQREAHSRLVLRMLYVSYVCLCIPTYHMRNN